jgi:hypothetical protein
MQRIAQDKEELQYAASALRRACRAQIDFPVWLANVSAVQHAAEQVVLMRADDVCANDVKAIALDCLQLTKSMLQLLAHKAADRAGVRTLSPSLSTPSCVTPPPQLCATPPPALMPVTIRTFAGETWRLSLSPTCTAQEAKTAVTCISQQRSDTPPANDALYVNGSRLADGDVLAAHGVVAGSLLHMVTF